MPGGGAPAVAALGGADVVSEWGTAPAPREVVELLLVIGQYMLVARVAETAGIEADEGGTAVVDAATRRPR